MGKRLSIFVAALGLLLGTAPGLRAELVPGQSSDRSGTNLNSGFVPAGTTNFTNSGVQGFQIPAGPVCKADGSLTTCRWDNIEVEYLQTRVTPSFAAYFHFLVIKGKDKEVQLIGGPNSKPNLLNAMASCERMALSSRENAGLFSFYVISTSSQSAAIEAAFQNNAVTINLDSPNFQEVGCFLTAGP